MFEQLYRRGTSGVVGGRGGGMGSKKIYIFFKVSATGGPVSLID